MVGALRWPAALPKPLAGAGMLGLGVVWSLCSALAHWPAIESAGLPLSVALLLVLGGGMLTVAGVWLGAGAVAWAIARLLGGTAGFRRVLLALSAAAPPLWLAAPALAWVPAGVAPNSLRWLLLGQGIAGFAGFLMVLTSALRDAEGFTWPRAGACTAITVVFCLSYLSLH